jgi:opacity protein-like surface antigen
MRAYRKARLLAAGSILAALLSAHARAQAWLPPQGEASLSMGYGNIFVKDHLDGEGGTFQDGNMRSNTIGLALEYAVTNRLSVDVGIPWVAGKYMGQDPHIQLNGTTLDDGNYHGTFTDLGLGVRWQALHDPVALTPYVAAIIPTHSYTYFAHSAPGKDLHQYLLGFFMGRRLDPILDDGYMQLRYSYNFVEKVIGISHNQSSADLTLGYFLTSALSARGILSYLYTHGGLSIDDILSMCDPVLQCGPTDPTPVWQHHDQITHDVALNAGFGLGYALTGSVDVSANYFFTVLGKNGHKVANGLSFGVTWNFSPVQVLRQMTGKPPATP